MENTKSTAIVTPAKQVVQSKESKVSFDDLTNRFKKICDTSKNPMRVTIVGAGSTGSNVALQLARLGVQEITIYDDDVVEAHNLGHQAFRMKDIDQKKVNAVADICKEAVGVEIKTHDKKTDGKEIDTDILVLCADSMKARKEISKNATYSYAVDGRMGGETFNIFSFSALEPEEWEKSLYSDEDASPLPCGGRSIGYISYICSGLMVNQIKKMIMGEEFSPEINFSTKHNVMEALDE